MEKTKLEKCLEKNLKDLRMPLGKRINYHELKLASEVDDITNPLEPKPVFATDQDRLLYSIFDRAKEGASFFQSQSIDEVGFLMQRYSKINRRIGFHYGIDAGKNNSSKNVDKIIKDKKFKYQFATVTHNKSDIDFEKDSLDFYKSCISLGGFELCPNGELDFFDPSFEVLGFDKLFQKKYDNWNRAMRDLGKNDEKKLGMLMIDYLKDMVVLI
jgi:hypothetical protein